MASPRILNVATRSLSRCRAPHPICNPFRSRNPLSSPIVVWSEASLDNGCRQFKPVYSTERRYSVQHSSRPRAPYTSLKLSRHLNTTQSLKAVKDSSTIDFAYFPQTHEPPAREEWIKVPFLPDNYLPVRSVGTREAADVDVMRPEISLVSHSSTHIDAPASMQEVLDNGAMPVNPYDLTKTVSNAANKFVEKVEKGPIKEVWNDFLDDVFGPKSPKMA